MSIMGRGLLLCHKSMIGIKKTYNSKVLKKRSSDKSRARRYLGTTLVQCGAKIVFTIFTAEQEASKYNAFIRLELPHSSYYKNHKIGSFP